MQKIKITNMHYETKSSLKRARTKYRKIPKAEKKINSILMCLNGMSARQIEQKLEISYQAVSRYVKAFNDGGLEKLLGYTKGGGRPPILSEQEQEFCKEMFLLTPQEAGIGIDVNWNSRIMQNFIKQNFGKHMSMTAIQAMLHRMGFSYSRPTYVLAKADKKNCSI